MILLFWLIGCAPLRCEAHGNALGTTWQVVWTAPTCDAAVELGAQQVIDDVEATLSVYADDSELHAIRKSAGPARVSESTYQLVRTALDIAAASGGAFDPTIEPVMQAWNLHGDGKPTEPEAWVLSQAIAQVGWDRIDLARTPDGAPTIDAHGAALDLTGLLEGHAADRISTRLQRTGLGNHVVTVGDEIRAGGNGPDGPWRVALDVVPHEPGADLLFRLGGGGLASSSGHVAEIDGKLTIETMDPRTGRPADTDVRRAVVIAPMTTEADALATAWVALGAQAGLKLIESRPDVEGLAYVKDVDKPVTSGGVAQQLD